MRLANVRGVLGERETLAAAPVPVKLTVCVPGLALSVMVSVPVRVPAAEGVKVTLMVQLEPALTLEPQLLAGKRKKSFVPAVTAMLVIDSALVGALSVTG